MLGGERRSLAMVMLNERHLIAVAAAILEARPDLEPQRLIDLARSLAATAWRSRIQGVVPRIVRGALVTRVNAGPSTRVAIARFVLQGGVDHLISRRDPDPSWAQEALTDWQLGRRRAGDPHPWIRGERERLRALGRPVGHKERNSHAG